MFFPSLVPKRFAPTAVALLTIVLAGANAAADTVTLPAVADNTMYSEDGNQSNGAGNSFFAGRTDNAELRRGLIRFDTSAIPPGSTVNAVTLTLYCSRERTSAQNIRMHRATASWGEGTSHAPGEEGSGAPATSGDATWTYRYFDTISWVPAGGEFVAGASATTAVGAQNQYYTWSTAGMIADVQGWVNAPAANFGWVVIGTESADKTSIRFESRQSTTPSYRPSLAVNYTPAVVLTGACCFGDGGCQVLSQSNCDAQGGIYQGNGTSCSPNPCPPPTGACCFANGSCQMLAPSNCTSQGGTHQGLGSTCTPNPCPPPTGACCLTTGNCLTATAGNCVSQGGTYQGDGVPCSGDLCPIILAPFVDALPLPAIAQPVTGQQGGAAHYSIPVREILQKMHRDLPMTRVWGYAGSYPGPTIVARRGLPVTVEWVNDLRDPQGNLRTTHYLPVDTCLRGPDMTGSTPLTVTHLHGGHVATASDGYPELGFPPGQASPIYTYPNDQPAATIWYHDHAMGLTRLNVYMGMAGFYLLRDDIEDALNLPGGEFEIGLAIQDRSFHPDGSLKYPATWHDHFFGDFIVVNGMVWPYLNVKQGKYRFHILNGSTSRTYTLSLSNGATIWQIGSDLGLLAAPVPMTALTITPGERADVVIDFAGIPVGSEIILQNSAPAPFPGPAGEGVIPNVMKFIVTAQPGVIGSLPAELATVERIPETQAVVTREFELRRMAGAACGYEMWMINGLTWEAITEFPRLGTTEIWSWVNRSGVTHPMHMHLVAFQVLDRQDFQIINDQIVPEGPIVPPAANEMGWKDTVQCPPNQITRVITRFTDFTGRYAYHCHILEHEEHEMMRQFQSTCYKGDANQDAITNGADISPFVHALVHGAEDGTAAFCATDMDDDGVLNTSVDVPLFVTCLLGNGCP